MDGRWLDLAIELAARCPASATAYPVGAVLVAPGDSADDSTGDSAGGSAAHGVGQAYGIEIARGHSREEQPLDHAEEVVLRRARADLGGRVDPGRTTLYVSLEPCGLRRSRPRCCADLIIAAGIGRIVYALREPPWLAPGGGAAKLTAAGLDARLLPRRQARDLLHRGMPDVVPWTRPDGPAERFGGGQSRSGYDSPRGGRQC